MEKQAICIISENLSPPIDEGIKHFAYSLIRGCKGDGDVLGLSVRVPACADGSEITSIKTNRLLLSAKLRAEIRRFRPSIICYVPSASATASSFLRSRVLKLYWPAASVVMVSLQPRHENLVSRYLIRFLSPDMVFVQDEAALKRLVTLGCPARLLPSGVDLEKFTPVSADKKAELRRKYHLEPQTFTVLHVGHATSRRNIGLLAQLQNEYHVQVVFVGSSLRHEDGPTLTSYLRGNGVIVLNEYFPNIEEIYQLSDCYLFPVFSDQSCIGVPLSVLEAMACNLPVVSVRYGSLPSLFAEGEGLVYADTPEKLLQGIATARNYNGGCRTREKVTPFSWQRVARYVLETTTNEENN